MKRAPGATAVVLAALIAGGVGGVAGWRWYQSLGGEQRELFALPDISGQRRSISEWDGKVLVVNFWATWCAPCRDEIPLFVDLQRKLGDLGVQFVGVAVDRLAPVKRFVDEFSINYPILHGIQSGMETGALYGNRAGTLPYTVVIDRDGYVRHIFARRVTRAEIAPVLRELAKADG